ncbi:leucyl/phenylalanyl-tRNA--protein transferase [Ignavibacteria bacterium]|nr:leucyl/phenylalanyl-tRNA--protein transferase [Bacteroidota bacterium]MCZ2132962.1 leucyl/phenylalanyl-tRNA--protein transferase [Bacteroidota bacterium]
MDLLNYLYNAPFSTESLFLGYTNSFFPMWIDDSGVIEWFSPDPRAVFPLDNIKISRSLRRTLRKRSFEFTVDTDFGEVIRCCSERADCWISDEIIDIYTEFHRQGYAHSVETRQNGLLVGGLYGVSIGSAFFGESMFSRVDDASKAAFAMLMAHLNERGFTLLDTQFINPHTESLGAVEIPRREYLRRLHSAVYIPCDFGTGWRDYSHKYL